jgi:hypothetical protein
MRPTRLLYLLSFFAPIAFLLGYIAGAPRPAAPDLSFEHINTKTLPVAAIDFYRNEDTIAVQETAWMQPNSHFDKK